MFKKTALAILVMLLLCSGLASCGRDAESGTIGDVDLSEPEETAAETGIFTKADSPYDYEYTSFSIKKAHMRFDVPTTWDAEFVNARYAVIKTPSDDGFLPDTSISILINYGENVSENEMSEYTLNNHAYNFSEFFKEELVGLPVYTGGQTRHLRSYVSEDRIRNGLDFVDEDHAEDAASLVMDEVVLTDKANNHSISDYGMVTTYVKWDNAPVCFFSVADQDHLDNAVSMLEYMASSITYEKADSDGFKEVSYQDFETAVPSTFVPVEGSENIYYSPLYENRNTAGMAVGVFTTDNKETITEENLSSSYGPTIAEAAYSPYQIDAGFNVFASKGEEESGPDFTGVISVSCMGYSDPTVYAGSVFGAYATYKADYYAVDKDGKTFIVAVMYQDGQKSLARIIGKEAVQKLKAK